MKRKASIQDLVWACMDERDMDKKTELYNKIRKKLSYPPELAMPSMITDDFIDAALGRI